MPTFGKPTSDVAEVAELRRQLELERARNRSHVFSVYGLRRTVARLRDENDELTRMCRSAGLIDEPSLYSSDEDEETEEEEEEEEEEEDGASATTTPIATTSHVVTPALATARDHGPHVAPLVVWPPRGLDPNDVTVVPAFDFGSLGIVQCDCHEVVGVMGCVCVGQCADMLIEEFALANNPKPGGGGFNDDGDWRGTVRTRSMWAACAHQRCAPEYP